ncbi:two-component system phosphate regulon response regulator PhoB [Rhizobium binae]|uniref:Two-component system phosphate regulon response regulator PhoB n=1 Tax=Rhizobium binae TaxID=1138190 RepID=A0ABV2MQH8_9HYPH|nr:response regulator transcription factor [Rhizobium binae]MBX4971003.1 response regulator transcription factor [Rhizobium binae]MBX4994958.1 response regulator transcription factor [Rhizobium binae]NKL52822.1 DNA-binding response regulator [Rhizobium leguminosarum bv. viciae]QSY85042.1 response regulator transcription factor [Rhizobium binae]
MSPVILVCSQDVELYLLLAHILRSEGFEARLASTDDDAVGACTPTEIAAVLLDCAGWPSDVARLCALLKDAGISVGALISGDMREQHLQLIKAGLDEGIIRPLSPSKLLGFLHGIKPRSEALARPASAVRAGFVFEQRAVVVGGKRISLTPMEARILEFLMERQWQITTREQLIEAVWPNPHAVESRTVDVHIGRLRKAFAGFTNLQVRTVYGAGYALEYHES